MLQRVVPIYGNKRMEEVMAIGIGNRAGYRFRTEDFKQQRTKSLPLLQEMHNMLQRKKKHHGSNTTPKKKRRG